MSVREGFRPIEAGVHTDYREAMSYADYLDLDTLLAAQHPRSNRRITTNCSSSCSIRPLSYG
jgi:hypothetical protein